MEIIIGREDGARRLHCVATGGRVFNIGPAGAVPLSVSHKHCRITIAGSNISIENINTMNATYVDGNQIFSKAIFPTSQVQLGPDKYTVPLQQVLQLACGGTGAGPKAEPSTFSLAPMEAVWNDYERRMMEIQDHAAKAANKQRLQGLLSLSAALLAGIESLGDLRYVIMTLALLAGIYFFVKGNRGAIVQRQQHDLNEEFASKYKCPNPKCGRPFGAIPYHTLKFNRQCFSCGCKYTH